MTQELATTTDVGGAIAPLNAKQLTARLAAIQDVMRHVMKDGTDYGVIPGTDKPSLFKPGAEKLMVTFRLTAGDPMLEAVPEHSGDIRYRVRVPVQSGDGTLIAVGIGECSTGEEKYRWRRPVHENEFLAAPDDHKREKFTRQGDVWRQVRVNPADVANTVLKMAHKRAYVHAVIMATAAGAIFTQDIEDLPDGVESDHAPAPVASRPPVQPPQRKSAQALAASAPGVLNGTQTFMVQAVTPKEMSGTNGTWTKFLIRAGDGKVYNTGKKELAEVAEQALAAGVPVTVTFSETRFGRDIKTLVEGHGSVEREAGADDR